MTPQAHLLLAEGDARLSELIRGYLRKRGHLVSAARDADHARRLLSGLEFDLVVIDASLSGATGLCDAIVGPVLCLVAEGAPQPPRGEILPRPFEPQTLATRIEALIGHATLPETPKILRLGALSFDPERGALSRGPDPVRLTSTEVALLRLLAAHPGEPLARETLADSLGKGSAGRAVDVQVTRLRRKLEADPRLPRHLQTVRGAGYMLVVD